jgi:hypothetical protein
LRVVALLSDGSMTDVTLGAKELMQSRSVGYSADSVLVPHASMHVSKFSAHCLCSCHCSTDDSSGCYKHATVTVEHGV